MFEAAVAAASPGRCVPPFLPPVPDGRTIVVGGGKAAAAMAQVVDTHWPAEAPLSGLVATRYGHGVGPLGRIEVVEASHPVPDAAGEAAAARMLQMVRGLSPDDLVLCLMSGGASSLLSLPAPGVDLAAKQAINRGLLRSGAAIGDMNAVRKHLSAIKGGRLAEAAWPAQVVTLMISDVPGDGPSVIGSGPTVADTSMLAQGGPRPCVLISGGETTLTVRGGGRGGRNAEFLLGLAVALDAHRGVFAIACDTDGIDGTEDNAGAVLAPDTLSRARALGLDALARLLDNDGYGFFSGPERPGDNRPHPH